MLLKGLEIGCVGQVCSSLELMKKPLLLEAIDEAVLCFALAISDLEKSREGLLAGATPASTWVTVPWAVLGVPAHTPQLFA